MPKKIETKEKKPAIKAKKEVSATKEEKFVPTFLAPAKKVISQPEAQEPEEVVNEQVADEQVADESKEERNRSIFGSQVKQAEEEEPSEEKAVVQEGEAEQIDEAQSQPDNVQEAGQDESNNTSEAEEKVSFASLMNSSSAADEALGDRPGQQNKESKKGFYIIVGILVLVILVMAAVVVFNGSNNNGSSEVLASVDRLVQLPLGEEPLVGLVSDSEVLRGLDSSLHRFTANGDNLIVFRSANLVIVYRAQLNKIVNMGQISDPNTLLQSSAVVFEGLSPVTTDTSPVATVVPTTTEESLFIEIRNGTDASGITLQVQKELTGLSSAYSVSKRSTSDFRYEESFVLDLSAGENEAVQKLADSLGYPLRSELPDGEALPEDETVQAIVFIGSDRLE